MTIDLWVLPVLATIVAVYSVLLNPENSKKQKQSKVLIVLLVVGCILQIYFGYKKQIDNNTALNEEKSNRKYIQTTLTKTQEHLTNAHIERDKLNELVEFVKRTVVTSKQYLEIYLVSAGASAETVQNIDETTLAASLQADRVLQLEKIINVTPSSVVWYFRKKMDEDLKPDTFIRILRERGFDVVEKNPNPKLKSRRINAIFYGKNVPEKDVKIVSLILMRAGVKLRWFAHSRFDTKNNVIQIGATAIDPNASYRPWSIKEILSTTNFAETGNPEKKTSIIQTDSDS